MKNKLRDVVRLTLVFLTSFMKKISLDSSEEFFFTKHRGIWMTYTHKNEYEMENISLNPSTYFHLLTQISYFFYYFPYFYQA